MPMLEIMANGKLATFLFPAHIKSLDSGAFESVMSWLKASQQHWRWVHSILQKIDKINKSRIHLMFLGQFDRYLADRVSIVATPNRTT